MMMVASNTKLLTAFAILQLVEQGKVRLEDDIKKHIPELNMPSRFKYSKITIRQILMHRSGIACDDYQLVIYSDTGIESLIPILNKTYLIAKPGTMYSYSNMGYALLGVVIERLTGNTYVDYIEEYVQKPLSISMKFLGTKKQREQYTGIISESFNEKLKQLELDPLSTVLSAGSNTYATIDDMTKLLRVFLNPSKQNILKEDTMKSMIEMPVGDEFLDDEIRHGLGLMFNIRKYYNYDVGNAIGHGGATFCHFSTFLIIPQLDIGITVLTNTGGGNKIIQRIMDKVLIEYFNMLGLNEKDNEKSKIEKQDLSYLENTYVALTGKRKLELNKKNQLQGKFGLFKFILKPEENEYFTLVPKGLSKLPIIREVFKTMKYKFREQNNRIIGYIRSLNSDASALSPYFSSYVELENTQRFSYLVGKYTLVSPIYNKEKTFGDSKLIIDKNSIIINTRIEKAKYKIHLESIDNTTFIIQGYGRYTGGTCTITTKGEDIYLNIFGLLYKKNA